MLSWAIVAAAPADAPRPPRRIQTTRPLLAWDTLEGSANFKTIRRLLWVIPDGELLDSPQEARGMEREDVPVRVAWGVLVLNAALRHTTIEARLR